MAAKNVGQLSDGELRAKLQSLGENVGPITSTTRRVWEKKLSSILKSRGDAGVDVPTQNKTHVADEQGKKKATVTKRRVSNNLSATGIGAKVSNSRKFAPFSSDDEGSSCINNDKKPVNKPKDNFVDANDCNIEITPSPSALRGGNKNRNLHDSLYSLSTPVITRNVPSRQESSNKEEFSDNDLHPALSSSHLMNNTDVNTNYSSSMINSNLRTKKLKTGCNRATDVYSHEGFPGQDGYSKLSSSTPFPPKNNAISNIREEIDASLIQIRKSYSRKRPSPGNYTYEEKDKEEEALGEQVTPGKNSYARITFNCISLYKILSLLIIALLLFVWLMYNGSHQGIPEISSESKVKDGINLEFINCLYQKLSILAGHAECGYVDSKWVEINNLPEFVQQCLVTSDKYKYETILTLNKTFGSYFELNTEGDLSSKSSYRPLFCRINQALSVMAYRLILIIITISMLIGGYFIMKKRWTADDEEMRQILYFVERIIDTLQRHHEVCLTNKDLPPFLPIPHVRDMLIPLAKRKKMARIWRKAVAFLNSSDSRVRVETQRIAGEDFDVWRWIGVCTPKLKKEKKGTKETYLTNEQEKSWQGPAFDEIEKVVRMPIVTPTPCLKIRYMHEGLDEKDPKWVKRVENAVLEKCNVDGAQILHIFVDKTSKEGCVYVKCDSLESAGRAFRCMYGNWFDCRLVIVKFVTLARYHQRFPDALRCVEPLKADTNMPSSLTWLGDDNK